MACVAHLPWLSFDRVSRIKACFVHQLIQNWSGSISILHYWKQGVPSPNTILTNSNSQMVQTSANPLVRDNPKSQSISLAYCMLRFSDLSGVKDSEMCDVLHSLKKVKSCEMVSRHLAECCATVPCAVTSRSYRAELHFHLDPALMIDVKDSAKWKCVCGGGVHRPAQSLSCLRIFGIYLNQYNQYNLMTELIWPGFCTLGRFTKQLDCNLFSVPISV